MSVHKYGKESKLDNMILDIMDLLRDKASHSFVARRVKTSRSTLVKFIYSRGFVKKESQTRPA